jgi:hypothetical protein
MANRTVNQQDTADQQREQHIAALAESAEVHRTTRHEHDSRHHTHLDGDQPHSHTAEASPTGRKTTEQHWSLGADDATVVVGNSAVVANGQVDNRRAEIEHQTMMVMSDLALATEAKHFDSLFHPEIADVTEASRILGMMWRQLAGRDIATEDDWRKLATVVQRARERRGIAP